MSNYPAGAANDSRANSIEPVYKDDRLIIFKCEDLLYSEYAGNFFVLEKSVYGYFHKVIKLYTKGNILDEFNITF